MHAALAVARGPPSVVTHPELHRVPQPVETKVDVRGPGVADHVGEGLLRAFVEQERHREGKLPGLDAIDIEIDVDGGLGLEGPHVAVERPPEVGAVEGAAAQVGNRGADVGDGTGDLLLDG